jgi:hypothetical protein
VNGREVFALGIAAVMGLWLIWRIGLAIADAMEVVFSPVEEEDPFDGR